MPNKPMTEERIAEISGREKAATQGPWVFEKPDGKVILAYTPKKVRVCESGCLGSVASRFVCDMHNDWSYTYKDKDEPLANAAFIAHAREDIPALLDEVERLRGEVGRMVKDGHGLRWTDEVPKNDGFYWKSDKKDWWGGQVNPGELRCGVVRIEKDEGKLYVDYCGWDIPDPLDKIANDCYWAGPIPQPQDSE